MITKQFDGTALSSRYGATVRSDTRRFSARFKLNGTEIPCAIKRIEITKGSAGGDTFTPGGVTGNSLTAELSELTTDIKRQRITVEIGLLTDEDNNVWEWVQMGEFLVTDVKKTVYNTTITGYGRTIADSCGAFNEPSVRTLTQIRTAISAGLGCAVGVEPGIDGSLVLTEPMANLTVYQAMQVLASVVGGYMCDIPDGSVRLCRYKNGVNTTLSTALMTTLPEMEEADFSITGVECIVSEASEDDEGAIPATGYTRGDPVNLTMTNQYMTAGTFEVACDKLIGYSYRPGKVNVSLGDPRLESTDVVNITDVDGTTYRMPCHKLRHIYDGGFRTEIEALPGTNIDNSIGTQTPLQRIITSIKSNVISAASIAKKAKRIAADTAQYFWFTETGSDTGAHITEIPQEQFLQDPVNGGGNLLARSNGIAIRDGLTELAQFAADEVRVGINDGQHNFLSLDYHSMQMVDKEGNTYVYISDLRDATGFAEIKETFKGDGEKTRYTPQMRADTYISVTVNGEDVSYTGEPYQIILDVAPPADSEVVIRYKTSSKEAKAYSFGVRDSTGDIGACSMAEGDRNIASGYAAHAEGYETTASGNHSHAEGSHSTASELHAHAEGFFTAASGDGSHAEGNSTEAVGDSAHAEGQTTWAKGKASHAEGYGCWAVENYSHAGGYKTVAWDEAQTVIGKHNQSKGARVFIIGNGNSSNDSNALECDWSGNITIAGTLTQSSDRRLKDHIDYIDADDAGEFIRELKPAHYKKDGAEHVGFYAQDVEATDKWHALVGEMNGFKTLDYMGIIAPLVAYCQHLERRIEKLEKEGK